MLRELRIFYLKHFRYIVLALFFIALGINFYGAIQISAQIEPHSDFGDTSFSSGFVVDIIFPTSGPLSGINDIYVDLSNAAGGVELYLIHGGVNTKLGDTSLSDPSGKRWYFDWDTSVYENGEYGVVAKVRIMGEYFVADPVFVQIENLVLPPQEEEILPHISPTVEIFLPGPGELSDISNIYIDAPLAEAVRLYISGDVIGTSREFLGEAQRPVTFGEWLFVWDTNQVENGEYFIFPEIIIGREVLLGQGVFVSINNIIQDPAEQIIQTSQILEEASEVIRNIEDKSTQIEEEIIQDATGIISEFSENIEKVIPSGENEENFIERLRLEEEKLKTSIENTFMLERENLSSESRDGDEGSILEVKERILVDITESFQEFEELAEEGFGVSFDEEFFERHIKNKIDELEEAIKRRDRIIKEDIGPAIFNDTDNDGVSDFDEINVYHTDPLNNDTDSDGISDGIEILLSSDPRNSDPDVEIIYEDPKVSGVVTENIFEIENIEVTEREIRGGLEVVTKIEISGTALPNSFVTIYIFSTPIIVTVQSDSNGRWRYELDKELSDGSHEIYVATVDNSGKILAKSNPVAFVKTAQAIEFIPSGLALGDDGEPRFLSTTFLITLAIALFIIFIVALMLVGKLNPKTTESIDQQNSSGSTNPEI